MNDARRRAAFHEAGHSVFAWALGLEVGAVQLLPETEGDAGRVGYHVPSNFPPEDRIAIILGGYYGAELSKIDQLTPSEFNGDDRDVYEIEMQVHPNDADARDALHANARRRAEALIAEHSAAIMRLAEELERRSELQPGEAAHLLGTARGT